GGTAAAAGAALLDYAAEQYRHRLACSHRPRAADGRRRPHFVRTGRVLWLRCLHHRRTHHGLRVFTVDDAAAVTSRGRADRTSAGPHHGAAFGPLPSAWDTRLGHRALLPLRPDRPSRTT